jgi:hypothetical protein
VREVLANAAPSAREAGPPHLLERFQQRAPVRPRSAVWADHLVVESGAGLVGPLSVQMRFGLGDLSIH